MENVAPTSDAKKAWNQTVNNKKKNTTEVVWEAARGVTDSISGLTTDRETAQ